MTMKSTLLHYISYMPFKKTLIFKKNTVDFSQIMLIFNNKRGISSEMKK